VIERPILHDGVMSTALESSLSRESLAPSLDLPLRLPKCEGVALALDLLGYLPLRKTRMTRAAYDLAGFTRLYEPEALVRQNLRNTVRYYRTLLRLPDPEFRRRAQQTLEVLNADRLARALAKGSGVVLLTVHVGAFEVAASWITQLMGVAVVAPVAGSQSRLLRSIDARARRACGVTVRPVVNGVMNELAEDLRSGAVVPIMIDRRPPRGGCSVRLFERDAIVSSAPLVLGARTQAPILPAITFHMTDAKQVLWFGEEFIVGARARQGESTALIQRLAGWAEQMISAVPEQWHVSPHWSDSPFNMRALVT